MKQTLNLLDGEGINLVVFLIYCPQLIDIQDETNILKPQGMPWRELMSLSKREIAPHCAEGVSVGRHACHLSPEQECPGIAGQGEDRVLHPHALRDKRDTGEEKA